MNFLEKAIPIQKLVGVEKQNSVDSWWIKLGNKNVLSILHLQIKQMENKNWIEFRNPNLHNIFFLKQQISPD